MSGSTIDKKKEILYFICFFFLLKPDYFSYMGTLTSMYNLGFLITFSLILLSFLHRHLLSKTGVLVLGTVLFPYAVSILEGVPTTRGVVIVLLQTVGLCMLLEIGVHKNFLECLGGMALLLAVYTYANFLTIIIFPFGLYDADFYTGSYWLLGYKNVMIRFLLPAVCVNAINEVYRKGIYTFRLYCLIAVSMLSLWIVDNKTGLVGLAFAILMLFLFSKPKLPKFFNLRNALIVVAVVSILLGTTSIISVFSPIIDSLGETISVMHRQAVWSRAVELFLKSPIFGYGLRSNDQYRELINLSTGWGYFSHPHNFILYTLLQGGLIGMGLIVWLFIYITRSQLNNRMNFGFKVLLFMYLSFLVMGMTESLTATTLFYPLTMLSDGFKSNAVEYSYFQTKKKRRLFRKGRKS